ncbi:tigger transposable element-derived protein 4 [Bemisia tabaci]|uniref:tigger transposable element-derived protein 4 n=1 Tax=Bemisia tabaci TaxID=7038 RepID=UPI003B27C570
MSRPRSRIVFKRCAPSAHPHPRDTCARATQGQRSMTVLIRQLICINHLFIPIKTKHKQQQQSDALIALSYLAVRYRVVIGSFGAFYRVLVIKTSDCRVTMSDRKTRRSYSVEEKLEIIYKYDEMKAKTRKLQKDIAKDDLKMSATSLNTILKDRQDIEAAASLGFNKTKHIKASPLQTLEDKLLTWFNQQRSANIPVNGTLLQLIALQLRDKIPGLSELPEYANFTASNGWLANFRKRHNIIFGQICGEREAVDGGVAAKWKSEVLPTHLQRYTAKDTYNADELGLFYNLLPNKSLVVKGDNCHGGKLSKQRVTVLLCFNSDGSHKLKPLVIGKSQKPRCFKNIKTLPVEYTSQTKAWMTGNEFIRWLRVFDATMGAQNRKIVLFIDHCPAHPPDVSLSNIELVFLPANATSILQPLDQGIIKVLKSYYRRRLIQHLAFLIDQEVTKEVMKISLLKAIHFLMASWSEVSTGTIMNCFKKAGIGKGCPEDKRKNKRKSPESNETNDEAMETTDCEEETANETETCNEPEEWQKVSDFLGESVGDFEDYCTADDEIILTGLQNLDDIAREDVDGSVDDDCAADGADVDIPPIRKSEVFNAVETMKTFLSQTGASDETMRCLFQVENHCIRAKVEECTLKQSSIDSFFALK